MSNFSIHLLSKCSVLFCDIYGLIMQIGERGRLDLRRK
jgi:hypothetical protein